MIGAVLVGLAAPVTFYIQIVCQTLHGHIPGEGNVLLAAVRTIDHIVLIDTLSTKQCAATVGIAAVSDDVVTYDAHEIIAGRRRHFYLYILVY